jgi:hypothetical protein
MGADKGGEAESQKRGRGPVLAKERARKRGALPAAARIQALPPRTGECHEGGTNRQRGRGGEWRKRSP